LLIGQILLEAAPEGYAPGEIITAITSQPGVASVHDVHVWLITSGFPALSAHVLVRPLTSFGFDSVIELVSATLVLGRLRAGLRGGQANERAERRVSGSSLSRSSSWPLTCWPARSSTWPPPWLSPGSRYARAAKPGTASWPAMTDAGHARGG
jgi:hypothetical protein